MASAACRQALVGRVTPQTRPQGPAKHRSSLGRRVTCQALPVYYNPQLFPALQHSQELVQPAPASVTEALRLVEYFPAPPSLPPSSVEGESGGDYKGYPERYVPKDDEGFGQVPGTPADSDAVDGAGRLLEKSAITPSVGSARGAATAELLKLVDYFPAPPSMPPSSVEGESGGDYKGYPERYVPKDDEGFGRMPDAPADSDAVDGAGRVLEKSPVRYSPGAPAGGASNLLRFVDYFPAPPSMPPSTVEGESGGDYKGYPERYVPKDDEGFGRMPDAPADSDATDVAGRVIEKSAIPGTQ